MKRYLRSVEPLVTPAEFEQIKKEVSEFEAGPGSKLHDTVGSAADRQAKRFEEAIEISSRLLQYLRHSLFASNGTLLFAQCSPVRCSNLASHRVFSLERSTLITPLY